MSKPRIVIVMDGGLIQQILADTDVEIATIDYDVEGTEDERLTAIPQQGGGVEAAYCWTQDAPDEIDKERVDELFAVIDREVSRA